MTKTGVRALSAVVGLLVVAPIPSSASETLTGDQIEQLVTGKTLTARRMGMTMRMHLNADGTIDARMGPMSGEGHWSIEGDALCTDMPRRPANMPRCQVLEFVSPDRLQSSNGLALTIE